MGTAGNGRRVDRTDAGALTALSVARLKRRGYHSDGRGLYLQITEGGRSWIFRYALDGRRRDMGLGSVAAFGLTEARERARQARQLLADGLDPIAHRQAERQALRDQRARAAPKTFEELAREFIAIKQRRWRNDKHGAQWISTLATYAFPTIGHKSVGAVTRADVLGILTPIWSDKSETAMRLQQRIRAILNWGAAHDLRPDHDGAMWEQIKKALEPHGQRARGHFAACAWRDVGAVLDEIRASPASEAVKLAIEFIVLAACRTGEARGATWAEIDFKGRCWTIPASRTKANREHRVPLSDRAIEILRAARALHAGPLVFPSPRGGALSDMAFTAALRRLGFAFTVHGFRSAFRDWAAESTSFPREAAELALAHAIADKTEAAYRRGDMFDKRRELMQAWAQHCAAPRLTAEVLALRAGA